MTKRFSFVFAAALGLVSAEARAYLPPSFYVYGHIAEQRQKAPAPGLQLSISRPMGAGTEELLGSVNVPAWQPQVNGWPSLSLLFAPDADSLIQSVVAFGIPVTKETELLRASREQVNAMKEPPRPFYKPDKRMSLKRHRQTYAWVHRTADKSVWVEKDTFLPLKVEAPCPDEAVGLAWAKPGKNICEIEFRNVYALRRGTPQNSRITLWKDGEPLLFLTFDRVIPAKSATAANSNKDSKLTPEINSLVETLLH